MARDKRPEETKIKFLECNGDICANKTTPLIRCGGCANAGGRVGFSEDWVRFHESADIDQSE